MRLKHRKCILYIFFLTAYGFISVIYLQSQSTQEFTIYDDVPDWESRLDGIKSYCNNSPVLLQKPRQLQAAGISEQKANHFTKIFQSDLLKNIVRIPSLRLDWCLVPKVASTSISQLLLRHLPKTRDSQSEPLFIQKEVWERAGRLTWQQYTQAVHFTRFLIVRHPFARIASAYRNKLEDRSRSHDGTYFYNTYSAQIIRFARGGFNHSAPEPSFEEFIDFLLSTSIQDDDEHWQPVALRCRMCEIAYTHIISYENLSTEWRVFLESSNLPLDHQLPWSNKGLEGSSNTPLDHLGQSGALRQYFNQISTEKLKKLAARYEADFKMFGYTIDEF